MIKKLSRDLWDEEYANGSLEGPELKRVEKRIREFQETKSLGGSGWYVGYDEEIHILYPNIKDTDYRYDTCLTNVLEYFPNLEHLSAATIELDVSPCPLLRFLVFRGNKLNISNNSALTYLACSELKELDVSHNTALTELYCGSNLLRTLDVSKNTALQVLNCRRNKLTELKFGKNTALTFLECFDNQLTELDLSHNFALQNVYLGSQSVKGLKVKHTNRGFEVNLKDYVSKIENIVYDSLN